jgi:hypothetical protein
MLGMSHLLCGNIAVTQTGLKSGTRLTAATHYNQGKGYQAQWPCN